MFDKIRELEHSDPREFWDQAREMAWTRRGFWDLSDCPETAKAWKVAYNAIVDAIEAEGSDPWDSSKEALRKVKNLSESLENGDLVE